MYTQNTRGICNIALGLDDCLFMGMTPCVIMQRLCRDAMADVAAKEPKDYVIATGLQYSVRDFVLWTADALGIKPELRVPVSMKLGW